jgi:hypothetical protein
MVVVGGLLACSVHAHAQTAWTVSVYVGVVVGLPAGPPVATVAIAKPLCNQPVPTTSETVTVFWDDPAVDGRSCVWADTADGPIARLPAGTYSAVLVAEMLGRLPSLPTAPVTFTKGQGVPMMTPTPTGFGVVAF